MDNNRATTVFRSLFIHIEALVVFVDFDVLLQLDPCDDWRLVSLQGG